MDELKNFIKANPKRSRPMLEEIKGETFEEYYKTIKDDYYKNLACEGLNKDKLSPLFIKAVEVGLLGMARKFWEIRGEIDKIPEIFEVAIPALRGGGYQPNKSDLDDSKPPQDTVE